jgi:nicotinamidase/pyrazinamidase
VSKLHLLIVDPQNDFCDLPDTWRPIDPALGVVVAPALPVAGAHADMQRLAALIRRAGAAIADITVTLDTHRRLDIAHTAFWRRRAGGEPVEVQPFTEITLAQLDAGAFVPADPAHFERARRYVAELESRGRHKLMAWPVHCEEGSWGHNVHADVHAAYVDWEDARQRNVEKITKGQNTWTEHYSAVQAEVPDDTDERTRINRALLARLDDADEILVAGEASSHCVAATVRDLAQHLPSGRPQRLTLLTDCMSPVTGCEALQSAFFDAMRALGAQLATASDVSNRLARTAA